jgi:lipopolysaccharide biosynthesis glycosyltransferase
LIQPLRIFIGYDPREAVAFHVCVNSIIRHASLPVSIVPLALNTIAPCYEELHKDGSNQFIYSRFLVPYLCNFRGQALFVDGDMIFQDDVAKLFGFYFAMTLMLRSSSTTIKQGMQSSISARKMKIIRVKIGQV